MKSIMSKIMPKPGKMMMGKAVPMPVMKKQKKVVSVHIKGGNKKSK